MEKNQQKKNDLNQIKALILLEDPDKHTFYKQYINQGSNNNINKINPISEEDFWSRCDQYKKYIASVVEVEDQREFKQEMRNKREVQLS